MTPNKAKAGRTGSFTIGYLYICIFIIIILCFVFTAPPAPTFPPTEHYKRIIIINNFTYPYTIIISVGIQYYYNNVVSMSDFFFFKHAIFLSCTSETYNIIYIIYELQFFANTTTSLSRSGCQLTRLRAPNTHTRVGR